MCNIANIYSVYQNKLIKKVKKNTIHGEFHILTHCVLPSTYLLYYTLCTTKYIFTKLHIVYYQVDITLITYSVLWSFLALWFSIYSAIQFVFIWLSSFCLMDPTQINSQIAKFC